MSDERDEGSSSNSMTWIEVQRLMRCGACVLALGLALGPAASAGEPITTERIVGVVNTEIILISEVKERSVRMGQPIDDSGPPEQKRKAEKELRAVLERMVDDVLVQQQANTLKLVVENSEVEKAVEEVKKQNNLTDEQMTEALGTQGYTPATYRRDVRKQLLTLKVINTAVRSRISVSDEDVKAFYDQSARRSGSKAQVHARHVLVTVPAGADDKTREQRRLVAARVVEEARGGTDFGTLAKNYSDDPSTKDKDGDLGWLSEKDGLPAALTEVLFAMDKDDVRGPIATDRGFEVLQVTEKKDSELRAFSEVKEQLRQQLYSQQLEKQTQTWLQELRKKAHVDIRL